MGEADAQRGEGVENGDEGLRRAPAVGLGPACAAAADPAARAVRDHRQAVAGAVGIDVLHQHRMVGGMAEPGVELQAAEAEVLDAAAELGHRPGPVGEKGGEGDDAAGLAGVAGERRKLVVLAFQVGRDRPVAAGAKVHGQDDKARLGRVLGKKCRQHRSLPLRPAGKGEAAQAHQPVGALGRPGEARQLRGAGDEKGEMPDQATARWG